MSSSRHMARDMSADPRSVRTRAALKQALLALLQRKDWDAITIVGICREARIARSSFYEHFVTKSDLLDELFTDGMAEIPSAARPGDTPGTLLWLVDHVAEAPRFFSNAMAGGRGDALLPRFRAALIKRLADELNGHGIANAEAKAAFVIGGAMAYLSTVRDEAGLERLYELVGRVLSAG